MKILYPPQSSQRAQRRYFFAFAGDPPKYRRTGRAANANPKALRAVFYIKQQ
jgi:hypothetical protein